MGKYSGRDPHLRLITDACPWGRGGAYTVDMWIVGWLATQITAYEVKLFDHAIGDPAGQQTWEALAILIGLRLYKQWWQSSRSVLEVGADNVTALAMVTLMEAKGPGVNLVARELALDLADGCYRPDITQHIPGITNGCSDTLSRRFQPGKTFILPKVLAKIAESEIPLRENKYYRAIAPPSGRGADEEKGA